MLRAIVLGAAAGGGLPQWNCACPVCAAVRSGQAGAPQTQSSIVVSADGERWSGSPHRCEASDGIVFGQSATCAIGFGAC